MQSQDPIARAVEQQGWPSAQAEQAAQEAIRSAFNIFGPGARAVRSALHGDWLHEPLHAVLTDVPVGSWTATAVFDVLGAASGSRALDNAADATLWLGLAGAAGAAVTGMNDWAEIRAESPRKIGAVHGLLNVVATGLFLASGLQRRRRATRNSARVLALLGTAAVSLSAHLGGNLIYEHGIGVAGGKRWEEATSPSPTEHHSIPVR